jgi:hypothetical protein
MPHVSIATTPVTALCCLLCACAPASDRAVDRAAEWLATAPDEAVRYDSAVVLSQIRKLRGSPSVQRAYARALAVARRDTDNPHRRFFDQDAGVTRAQVSEWNSSGVTNPNPYVSEALWCDVYGLRPSTLEALDGIRDDGGYHSTHVLWALDLAHERGCLDGGQFAQAGAAVRAELYRTQPDTPGPGTLDVDLFAERLIMLRLAGEHGSELDRWAAALLKRQNADGSFGGEGPSVQRFHATMVAAWALVLK